MTDKKQRCATQEQTRGLGRRLAVFVVLLGLAIAGGYVLIGKVIGPGIVRVHVAKAMAKRWPGRVEVGRATFDYSRVGQVDHVRLYDPNGSEAIHFSGMTVTLTEWPGIRPKLKHMAISRMEVHVVDGHELDGFFKSSPKPKPAVPKKRFLEAIEIRDLVIRDGLDAESDPVWDGVFVRIEFKDDKVNFSAENGISGEGMLGVAGSFLRKDSDLEMVVQFRRHITPQIRRVVYALLRFDSPWQGRGVLAADIKLSGNLKKLGDMSVVGDVHTVGWTLVLGQTLIGEDIDLAGRVKGARVEFDEARGLFCSGDVQGKLHIDFRHEGGLLWGGDLTAKNLDIDEFLRLLGHQTGRSSGQGHLQMNFEVIGKQAETLDGNGHLVLKGADFGGMPVIKQIFYVVGMKENEPLKMSDAEAGFHIKKGLLGIERGHISNQLSAIEVEPGGEINLVTGEMDFYVIGVMLRFVNSVLENVPLVRRFVSFKDKLIRLHVQGFMSPAPGYRITKEPLRDISEGFVEAFSEIAKNGGRLADGVLKIIGSPFRERESQSQ